MILFKLLYGDSRRLMSHEVSLQVVVYLPTRYLVTKSSDYGVAMYLFVRGDTDRSRCDSSRFPQISTLSR